MYKHTKTIKRFFNWLMERGYIAQSPAQDVINKRPALLSGEGKAATEDEVIACLIQARRKPRDWAIMLLLTETGARASEIANLKIRNLSLADNQATIDGKGSKRRTIWFLSDASAAIAAWLAVRPAEATHNYVFTSTRGHGA